MAQAGYTPISLYYSTTAAAVPTSGNLASGELAINITDGKLYYKSNAGVVTLLAGATAGPAGGSNTQVQFNSSGALAGSANLTFNGTTLTANTIGAFTLSGTIAGGGNQINNVIIGTTTPLAGTFTQLDITAQGTLRLQDTTGGEYVALRAPSSLAGNYTLTFPADDGTSGQALITDGSGVLSWSTAASGDVYGPASATDNALARFDGTTGKLIKDSSGLTFDGSQLAVTGTLSAGNGISYFNNLDANIMLRVGVGITSTLGTGEGLEFSYTAPQAKILSYNRATSAYKTLFIDSLTTTLGVSGSVIATVSSTGLAVTGTVSGTDYVAATKQQTGFLANSHFWAQGADSNGNYAGMLYQMGTGSSLGKNWNGVIQVGSYGLSDFVWLANTTANATNVTTTDEIMRLVYTGNLGIGTSSPAYKLDVNGSAKASNFYFPAAGGVLSTTDAVNSIYIAGTGSNFTSFTTNSAERMRLDASGNLGIGTTAPSDYFGTASKLVIANTGGDVGMTFASSATGAGNIFWADATSGTGEYSGYIQYSHLNDSLIFATASTERARIDSSGNVGIGTTSPALGGARAYSKVLTIDGGTNTGIEDTGALEVGSSTNVNDRLVGGITFFNRDNSGSGGSTRQQVGLIEAKCVTSNSNVNDDSGGTLVFLTKAEAGFVTEKMRLDSAGNLGIGVTPNTMNPGSGNIQLGNSANRWAWVGVDPNGAAVLAMNTYYNSGYKYAGSYGAGMYLSDFGAHKWFTAASGTADAAITFTQRMTLDTDGNLLVGGTTSPSGKAGNFVNLAGSGGFWTKSGGVGYFGTFDNYAMILATNDTERARIDSSGNVGVSNGMLFVSRPTGNTQFTSGIGINASNTTGEGIEFLTTASVGTRLLSYDRNVAAFRRLDFAGNEIHLSPNNSTSVIVNGFGLGVGASTPSSGTGITFPATQSASSDANTLDDYEEGTFTPSVSAASGSYTTVTATGKYVKVGRLVTIRMRVNITTNGTASNAMILGNIPFPTTDNNDFGGGTREDVGTGYAYTCSGNGTTEIRIQRYDATYGLGDGQGLTFCISYVAA